MYKKKIIIIKKEYRDNEKKKLTDLFYVPVTCFYPYENTTCYTTSVKVGISSNIYITIMSCAKMKFLKMLI